MSHETKIVKIVQNCDMYIGRACFRDGWQLKSSRWKNPFSLKNTKIEILYVNCTKNIS